MSKRSYDLSQEMIERLTKEANIHATINKLAEELKGGDNFADVAKRYFSNYGRDWAKKTLELGERYTDQTYENLKEVAKHVKGVIFPHFPQRFVEIGYLAIQPFEYVPIHQNNHQALSYRIPGCFVYQELRCKCGNQVAEQLPCQHSCLNFAQIICEYFNLPVYTKMTSSMPVEGFCQFYMINTNN